MKVEKIMNDDKAYPCLAGRIRRKYWMGTSLLTVYAGKKAKEWESPPLLCSLPIVPAIYVERKEAAELLKHWRKGAK
jgi:hypothetical protein